MPQTSNRERCELRGPVRSAVTTWADGPDSEVSEQYVFDSAGAIRQWRKVRRQGGQTVEEWSQSMPSPPTDDCSTGVRVDDVSALSSWTMPPLHGTGFGTFGAATAKTFFDEQVFLRGRIS
ncbi:MAG: hypothetical protein JNL98_00660 [Bryobacterales bacterium]|nr:hypothetical protein [Bryobacterales bacterium]